MYTVIFTWLLEAGGGCLCQHGRHEAHTAHTTTHKYSLQVQVGRPTHEHLKYFTRLSRETHTNTHTNTNKHTARPDKKYGAVCGHRTHAVAPLF